MVTPLSKLEIGLRSALRSLIPVVVVVAGMYAAGDIKELNDLWSPSTVAAILVALGIKGGVSAVTAKSVEVKKS